MNFIDVDNLITTFLMNNIKLYKKTRKRHEIYQSVYNRLDGRVKMSIDRDMAVISELRFTENLYHLYKTTTSEMIKKYMKIIKTPIKRNAIHEIERAEQRKRSVLREYLDCVKSYIPQKMYENLNIVTTVESSNSNYCETCDNSTEFIKEGDLIICCTCYSEVVKMSNHANNNSRSNQSGLKCNYDRVNHFKECLKQYQAKQNTFISPTVYSDLERALRINGLLSRGSHRRETFKRVRKSHILYFLKELGYTKHYDDFILIHSNLTGVPAKDISRLESDLINDFEKVVDKYTVITAGSERKNFINMQFILYRLLQRHGHPIDPEDFSNIKSFENKVDRDSICMKIFKSLGWEYKG